ncbi:hypothetical protein DICPUDRAFT_148469 [Dictyostelium purpureum]|uniref:THH1/TOM1/TOM3 domain-containing protein n=1 Tax=Dictyostelium purpureum TaxID=5786 RepID=F0ZB74_DICPU|nr:uncharacterized protein DICPUDRAFT_148469 [Dictyostelium purpureum]EGC38771.1 hypothetical protein DICPUDRAFT_148469 [Dictyostelium purpureum]|eukprot:XP_003284665.1 hypothetical protein DICPUDRAFT_148469 [Dictyostelium purpureum]
MGTKIIKISHYLILLLYIVNKGFCSINVLSSDIIEKSSNLLGINLNYAYLNVELDEEVVRYDTLACPNYECPVDNTIITPSGIDCSCDYTGEECPKKLSPECGSKVCDEFASDGETPMCFGNWEKIEQGQQLFVNILNGETKNFRYKANAEVCESLLVVIYPIVGFFRGSVGATPITNLQRNLPYEHVQTYNIMNLCPTDNQGYTNTLSWTKDTYFISIEPIGTNVTFSIQIYSNETPNAPIESSCQTILNDAKCVIDGQAVTDQIQGPAYNYYTFQVTKPDYYFISAPALYQDINLFISDDPSLPYPVISNPGKWQSAEEYDDYLLIFAEPINSTHPTTLFIGIYCSYPSNYTFTVTSQGYRYPVNISALPENAGAYALTKSSRLILPDGTNYNCPSWYLCFPFSVQYPLFDGNALWPVSTYFSSDKTFQNIHFENSFLDNPFKPKSYQASFLLSLQSDSTNPYIYQTFDTISNSKIEFISTLFNTKGQPLKGIHEFKKRELECDYNKFQNILNAVEKTEELLFSVSDLNELNNWRYKLDSLTFRDDWIACLNEAKSLLDTQTIKANVSSIFCPYSSNSIQFANDPCCNASLSFFECCNPKTVEITQTDFIGTHNDLIKDQCSSFECTQSVLSDFYNSINSVGSCSVSNFATQNLKSSVTQVLRDCKNNTFKYCNTDSDCSGFSNKKCDLFTRNCLIDFEILDKNYIKCVLENIPPSTLYGLAQVSPSNITTSIIEQQYQANQLDDCISESSYPIRQMITYTSPNIPNNRCYPPAKCLDQSCELEHDICFDQVYTNFREYPWLDISTCQSIGFCPVFVDGCSSVDYEGSECNQNCDTLQSFCGHCTSNETYCHHVSSLNDQSSCEISSSCLLPSGDYALGLTKEECEGVGMCTGYCGYTCGDNSGCLITGALTPQQCSSHANSQWINDMCFYNTQIPSQCSSNGYIWEDCSIKSVGECSGPTSNTLNFCSLAPTSCSTEQQCLSQGGVCSDLYFFLQENTAKYSSGLGKCVRGHFEYRSGFYPSCNFENENDSPMGCFEHVPKYLNKSSCESASGKWWVPSVNKEQCTSTKGCKTLDLNSDNLPINFRFNQMTEDLCTNCYQSQNKWTNMFEWTSSQWIKGVYLDKLTWVQNNKFKLITEKKKAFSYQSFYYNIMNVVDTQIADLLRSESFCRLERIQSNLNSVACSCSGEGGPTCFKSSVPLLGQTKPCFGESSTFTFDYGQLHFTQDSIIGGCPSLLISQLSKENFMAAVPESLSSNFVNYYVIDRYGVLNKKDAIVGILLEDGINIKAQFSNIKSVTVCFNVNSTTTSRYPTYDFASTNDEKKPYPLNADIFEIKSNSPNTIILCSNFTQDFILEKNELELFAIIRRDNWENQKREVFNQSTKGLIFTLATFYLLVSFWGFFQIGYIFNKQRSTGQFKFQLVHLLIIIVTVFIIMRSIYFYVLGNGHLAFNPVGDYILVILPTFLYFTTFTIVVVLFYVLVYLSYRTTDQSKRIFKMVFLINFVIYLLFIACALVFKKTQNIPTNDCGSRIIIPMSSSIPQKAISITYAVVQCVISVILGIAFIYLGVSLYLIVRKTKKSLNQTANSSTYNRIFLQTSICSVGFILHCIFILILVTGNLNNMTFSFICLIITEIIPTITLLYCYDPRHKNQKKEISMNSSNIISSDS